MPLALKCMFCCTCLAGAGAGSRVCLLAQVTRCGLQITDCDSSTTHLPFREVHPPCASLPLQAAQSPLTVAVAAGAIALPTLLKLAALFEKKQLATDLHTCEQLPVEIELGPEFVFHSIFACPVSRDQSTAENPPVLLPCNHVLCEQSVLKIAKSRTRMFKCPYCPTEVSRCF